MAAHLHVFDYDGLMASQVWLITGGAGYIGAHVADRFLADAKDVVIYDSLSSGLESRIQYLRNKYNVDIPLINADLRDLDKFEEALRTHKPCGIIHTAALKSVAESMEKHDEYFDLNHLLTLKMLEITSKNKITNFIFSSTAAIYGAPYDSNPIKEDAPKKPISPYGASKLAAESEVEKFLARPGNRGTSLRFFNVVGAEDLELLDNSTENLVPIVIDKLRAGEPPIIYGTNHSTPDGTCLRDYVDVRDIAQAHLAAANSRKVLPYAMNVGTGSGRSVRDVIRLVSEAYGSTSINVCELDARPGDPENLCADITLIKRELNFQPRYTLEQSIRSLFF
jgi:UDP-glucose 4-epimerase